MRHRPAVRGTAEADPGQQLSIVSPARRPGPAAPGASPDSSRQCWQAQPTGAWGPARPPPRRGPDPARAERGIEALRRRAGARRASSFATATHSIHAILGENGAGKSTLIKIVGGVVRADSGQMLLDGQEVRFHAPRDAIRHGVVCVFQELSLLPDLSVADNICITGAAAPRRAARPQGAAAPRRGAAGLDRLRRHQPAAAGQGPAAVAPPADRDRQGPGPAAAHPHPRRGHLGADRGRRRDASSASCATCAARALAVLYISHRMHEVEELADTCTVFRGGRHIETFAQGSKGHDEIVQMMIGREITQVFPPKPARREATPDVLSVEGLSWTSRLSDVTLSVGKGEIVGLGGLDGQGQRELLLGLFGVLRDTRGTDQGQRQGGLHRRPGRGPRRRPVAGDGARGPQERRAHAVDVGAREHDARLARSHPPRAADRPAPRRRASSRAPPSSCRSRPPRSTRRSAASPAATSRRWCWRSG